MFNIQPVSTVPLRKSVTTMPIGVMGNDDKLEVQLTSVRRKEEALIHECVLFPSIRLKPLELQLRSSKPPLPIIPFHIVAYAYTLWVTLW